MYGEPHHDGHYEEAPEGDDEYGPRQINPLSDEETSQGRSSLPNQQSKNQKMQKTRPLAERNSEGRGGQLPRDTTRLPRSTNSQKEPENENEYIRDEDNLVSYSGSRPIQVEGQVTIPAKGEENRRG